MNTEQLARFLSALERIADASERLAAHADAWAEPIRIVVPDGQTPIDLTKFGEGSTQTTKGPYR